MKALVKTAEIVDLDKLAEEAAGLTEAIKDLDEHLLLLSKLVTFDFQASIKFLEVAKKFRCTETQFDIEKNLRESNPFSWAAYLDSHRSDMSSADGSDNR